MPPAWWHQGCPYRRCGGAIGTYIHGRPLLKMENGKSLCPQILGSSDKRVLSMDVLKVVMGQLNQMYSIQCLFVSSRRGADLG